MDCFAAHGVHQPSVAPQTLTELHLVRSGVPQVGLKRRWTSFRYWSAETRCEGFRKRNHAIPSRIAAGK